MPHKQTLLLLTFVCSTLLLGGCPVVDENNLADEPEEETKTTTKQLRAAGSNSEFERYIKQAMISNEQLPPQKIAETGTLETMSTAASADANTSASPASSGTNTIVTGVDEADRIKTYNSYLYTALLPDYSVIDGERNNSNEIRISRLQADPAASEHVGLITTPNAGHNLSRLYLLADEDQQPAILANVIQQSNIQGIWFSPWSWGAGQTDIYLHELTDPANPSASGHISIDGQIIDSRRIGDQLYLVTRFTPQVPQYIISPATNQQKQNNQALLDSEVSLMDLIPSIEINDEERQSLFDPAQCFVPDSSWKDAYSPAITSITRINLRDPKQFSSRCFGGQVDGIYATPNNIYLTRQEYSRWGWGWPTTGGITLATDDVIEPALATTRNLTVLPTKPETIIHKFALSPEKISYRGSGSVPGNFDGGDAAFRLGEQGEYTYAITTRQEDSGPKHFFTTLREAEQKPGLELVAQLPNAQQTRPIGKPNERLYATRFMGQRAYLITYERIDPLYVMDLSQADQPQLRGELEVPGFSDYLHPISNDLLLGIGRHTNESNWVSGLKLSLFDVSNVDQPTELESLIIGDTGSYSPALYDHHAVSHLAPGDHSSSHRLAIPMLVTQQNDPSNRWNYSWLHNGLYLFEVDEASATQTADLSHHGVVISEQNPGDSNWPQTPIYQDRSVLQGGAVHYQSHNKLISADWSAALASSAVTQGEQPKPTPGRLTSSFSITDAQGNTTNQFKLGQAVHIELNLINNTDQAITYQTTAPGHSITISNEQGVIWNKFHDIAFIQVVGDFTIAANSTLSLGAIWEGTNNSGELVSAGEYTVEARINAWVGDGQLPAQNAMIITLD